MKIALWVIAVVCVLWGVGAFVFPIKASPESRWRGALAETWDILGHHHSPDMGWDDTNRMVSIKLGTLIEVERRAEEPDLFQNAAHFYQRASAVFAFVAAGCALLLGRKWNHERGKSC